MKDRIFALDIGTRSVTGIILEKRDQTYHMLDYYMMEHKERSMRDGQIHNVVAVSETIIEVKNKLESSHGSLSKVCVAAAGRALMTTQATASKSLQGTPITSEETIKHLELSAVQMAQLNLQKLQQDADLSSYYCVGYSVLHYRIDQQQIGSLIDQRGTEASVEIIATFLPKVVVESLLAALGRANLEMEALTLEPIAAIHVLIPESMRRLNVVLVDIGAGTSDIAITDKGTVVAYGMVPIAGDEITEAISDQYLLDFPSAEKAKRMIVDNGEAIVEDILGFEATITPNMIENDITDAIDNLATQISNEIINLNSHSPKAVMLVGGGSLTPGITNSIASKLNLPINRVAVRGIDAINQLEKTNKLPTGPDFVTPIGIGIAAKQNPVHYVSVTVNGNTIRLFEMKELTVGDCLIQSSIDIQKWYGKPGIASIITINNKEVTLPGELGEPPSIQLNDTNASVNSKIHNGDIITIEKGRDGKHAQVTIQELLGDIPPLMIYYNGAKYHIYPQFEVNNVPVTKEYSIQDRDNLTWRQPNSLEAVLNQVSSDKVGKDEPFIVYVNEEPIHITKGEPQIALNGKPVTMDHRLKQGDRLQLLLAEQPTVKDVLSQLNKPLTHRIMVSFNNESVELAQPLYVIKKGDSILDEDTPLKKHDRLKVQEQEQQPFIYQDIFRYVDLDLTNANGKFSIYQNDAPSSFHSTIKHGDHLQIIWE